MGLTWIGEKMPSFKVMQNSIWNAPILLNIDFLEWKKTAQNCAVFIFRYSI